MEAQLNDNEGIFIVNSFQEGGFIESKVKVKWSFPPHNPNRVLTLEGPPVSIVFVFIYLFYGPLFW